MELESQLSSLELSNKLEKLGVKQESLYKWNVPELTDEEKEKGHGYLDSELVPKLYTEDQWEAYTEDYIPPSSKMYSAFTVAELGEMLKEIDEPMPWHANGYWWFYEGETQVSIDTEANARAKMLIYLLENKLI